MLPFMSCSEGSDSVKGCLSGTRLLSLSVSVWRVVRFRELQKILHPSSPDASNLQPLPPNTSLKAPKLLKSCTPWDFCLKDLFQCVFGVDRFDLFRSVQQVLVLELVLGGPFDLVSRVTMAGYGGL